MVKTRGGGSTSTGTNGDGDRRGSTSQLRGRTQRRGRGRMARGLGRAQSGGRGEGGVIAEVGVTIGGSRRKLRPRRMQQSEREMDHDSSVVEDRGMEAIIVVEPIVDGEGEQSHTDKVNSGEEDENVASGDNASVEGDDCEVVVEDTAGYRETEEELNDGDEAEEEEEEAEMVDVEVCNNMEDHFGEEAHEVEDESDHDSGDDVWNDDTIPDPLYNSDDEVDGTPTPVVSADELIGLGKMFNNAEEFKYTILRYSLKTQFDIKMYKSSSDRLGAKCTRSVEDKCPFRVYCSFERARSKLM